MPSCTNPCSLNPCQNGGICINTEAAVGYFYPFCECPNGYGGKNCQLSKTNSKWFIKSHNLNYHFD